MATKTVDEWWEYWGVMDAAPTTMQVVTDGFVMQPGFVPRREIEYSEKEITQDRKKIRKKRK